MNDCKCKCKGASSSRGARGPAGERGETGLTGYKSVNNTVFVDQDFGLDSTGVRERLDLPFKTITAAQTAAVSGDTIHVFPGTYTDYSLGKDGVSFYFSLGANITITTGVRDIFTVNDFALDVMGYGRFQSTGCLLKITGSMGEQIINIQGISAIVENGSTNGSGLIESTATGLCTVYVTMIESIFSNHSNLILIDATKIYLTVTAPYIYCKGAVSNYISNNASEIIINGPVRQAGSPYSYAHTYNGLFRLSASQILTINGDCLTIGTSLNNGTFYANKNITMSSSTTEVITHSGVLLYVKGKIKNSTNNANAHCLVITSAGTTILDGAKFVCTHASALSIYTAGAKDIIVYTAYANRNVTPALITNIISGTVLYVDSDVQ